MRFSNVLKAANALENGVFSSQGPRLRYVVQRTVPHNSKEFLNVVKSVHNYESFLPFCKQSTISEYRSRSTGDGVKESATGTLHIGFGNIIDKYTSRVTYLPAEQKIVATSIDGHVFEEMTSTWEFTQDDNDKNSSTYKFQIEGVIGNPLYKTVAKANFTMVSSKMAQAFENEVDRQAKEKA